MGKDDAFQIAGSGPQLLRNRTRLNDVQRPVTVLQRAPVQEAGAGASKACSSVATICGTTTVTCRIDADWQPGREGGERPPMDRRRPSHDVRLPGIEGQSRQAAGTQGTVASQESATT
jgi:hypothetical protein